MQMIIGAGPQRRIYNKNEEPEGLDNFTLMNAVKTPPFLFGVSTIPHSRTIAVALLALPARML